MSGLSAVLMSTRRIGAPLSHDTLVQVVASRSITSYRPPISASDAVLPEFKPLELKWNGSGEERRCRWRSSEIITLGTATGAPPEDLSQYADSAAWADSEKSLAVKMCESGNNYAINTGNGYYGAWQFDYPSWHDNGGGMFAEYPHQATKAQQDYIAWTYWRKAGWRPWECG